MGYKRELTPNEVIDDVHDILDSLVPDRAVLDDEMRDRIALCIEINFRGRYFGGHRSDDVAPLPTHREDQIGTLCERCGLVVHFASYPCFADED